MRSAGRFYRLWLAYAAAGMAAVGVAAVAAVPALDFSASTAQLMAVCDRFVLPATGVAEALVLSAAIAALIVVAVAVRSLVRELLIQRRLRARIVFAGGARCEPGGAGVIEDPSLTAFCAGLLRPRVYVSRGALQTLSEPELDAVLIHERHHADRRDPLRLFAMRILGDALFMLPAVKRLGTRYRDAAELAADEAAVRTKGSAVPLASALLKFDEAPAYGAKGIAPERVDHLLGDPAPGRLPVRSMAAGALVTAALTAGGLAATALDPGSVSVPGVLARSCMLVMTAAVVGLAVWALKVGKGSLRAPTRQVVRAPASR